MGLNDKCPIHGSLHPDYLCPDRHKKIFEEKLKEWKKGTDENKRLMGALMEYGAVVGEGHPGTLWDVLKEQIDHQAEKKKTTLEEFIDYLFGSEDADTFMLRLQL